MANQGLRNEDPGREAEETPAETKLPRREALGLEIEPVPFEEKRAPSLWTRLRAKGLEGLEEAGQTEKATELSLKELYRRWKAYKEAEQRINGLPEENPLRTRFASWLSQQADHLKAREYPHLAKGCGVLRDIRKKNPRLTKGVLIAGGLATAGSLGYEVVDESMEWAAEWSSPIEKLTATAPVQPLTASFNITPTQITALGNINTHIPTRKEKEGVASSTIVTLNAEGEARLTAQMNFNLRNVWRTEEIQNRLWVGMEERLGERPTTGRWESAEIEAIQGKITFLLQKGTFIKALQALQKGLQEMERSYNNRGESLYFPQKKASETGWGYTFGDEKGNYKSLTLTLRDAYQEKEYDLSLWATKAELKALISSPKLSEAQIDHWRLKALQKTHEALVASLTTLSETLHVEKIGDKFMLTSQPFKASEEDFRSNAKRRLLEAINQSLLAEENSYDRRTWWYDVDLSTDHIAERLADFILENRRWPQSKNELPPYQKEKSAPKKQSEIPKALTELLGTNDVLLEESSQLSGQELERAIVATDGVVRKLAFLAQQAKILDAAYLGGMIAELHQAFHCTAAPWVQSDPVTDQGERAHRKYFRRYEDPHKWNRNGKFEDEGEGAQWDLRFNSILSFILGKDRDGNLVLIDQAILSRTERVLRWVRANTCPD